MRTQVKHVINSLSLPTYRDAHDNLYVECCIENSDPVLVPVIQKQGEAPFLVMVAAKSKNEFDIIGTQHITSNGSHKWTGGHRSPRQLPEQKANIPTTDEQISIADCVD